jgi:hypothetical protein
MLKGLGVVGHKYGSLFVQEVGTGKETRDAYRIGLTGTWIKWIPTFIAVCDNGHEDEYTTVELFKDQKCKQCNEGDKSEHDN